MPLIFKDENFADFVDKCQSAKLEFSTRHQIKANSVVLCDMT